MLSPDGKKIAFNKVRREHRTWKRYTGGLAQEIYIYDLTTNKEQNISNFKGTDRIPMWIGDKVYFSSDRDRVLNIYCYDTKTGDIEQLTQHKEYDVRRPSKGGKKIVYELGGTLCLLDVTTNQTKQIPVQILADAPEVRPYLKKVNDFITGIHCSPAGERALIVARGEIFSVPKEKGATRNLTGDSGVRDKDAAWSPDGKTIAYLSDKDSEYNIYLIDPKGTNKPVQLTNFKDGYRHTFRWSPDSKKIAFADQTLSCYYLDVNTKKVTKIDKAEYENVDISLDVKPIYDFQWSPDSCYIAYLKMDADLVTKVYIYALETGKSHCVSNGIFNDFNPIFSTDGEHLFFISNRRFDPTFCDFEWEMVYKKVAGIYCLTLKKDGEPLLRFESDEVKKEANKTATKETDDEKLVTIDFENIAEVEVDKKTGQVQVKRVVCAQDMGLVVNPEGAKIQIEGCITMGLGYALTKEIHFKGGQIFDTNFDTYELPRFSWLPKIETVLVDSKEDAPQGGGEPAIICMGAVIANAIYDAVAARLFQLPMTPERIKAIL